MGNNAAHLRVKNAPPTGKAIALSSAHAKRAPSPAFLLIDVFIHNGDASVMYWNPACAEPTCKNSLFWTCTVEQTPGEWVAVPYTGAVPDDKPLTQKEIDKMATAIKPFGHAHGEGVKLHECFKFEAGKKYRITAEFAPLPNRGDEFETVEIQL